MEKKLVLKKKWKVALVVLVILSLFYMSYRMDKDNYDNAVERCNGSENVVKKYTKTGDAYYVCKAK